MGYFTEGEKRWIKRHTEKSLKELYGKTKGVNMKPTKKKPAKRNDNPIIGKLLQLKYRINDTATTEGGWSDDMSSDKAYIQGLIHNIRKRNDYPTKIQLEECNKIWRKYA